MFFSDYPDVFPKRPKKISCFLQNTDNQQSVYFPIFRAKEWNNCLTFSKNFFQFLYFFIYGADSF